MADVPGCSAPLLDISNLDAYYGESHVLHGVNLQLRRGELVTLLGRNGAGKTTTLRAIMGLAKRRGQILYRGQELSNRFPEAIARLGIGYVPEERAIFSSLSVEENLMLPPVLKSGGFSVEELSLLFPNLWERRRSQGTKLSGGEQQMLAIARILRTGADLILLDEPTEGLAPVIIEKIGLLIVELKRRGYTILLVEQNFEFARTVADRHYLMENGHVVDMIENLSLTDPAVVEQLNRVLGL